MIVALASFVQLAAECAPAVHPTTLLSLVSAESGFRPYAINDNSTARRSFPESAAVATALARGLVARGHSIDMGLAQINSRTAPHLGLSIADAFDPCRNLAAAARLMSATYRHTAAFSSTQQQALGAMLSVYNTGNSVRGYRNGYVSRVYLAAARFGAVAVVPAIDGSSASPVVEPQQQTVNAPKPSTTAALTVPVAASRAKPWSVFDAGQNEVMVFELQQLKPKGRIDE